ncbi:hypothetical protein NCLIV_013040 [Neospora caninum Liverpool]|uniref:Uncharacterized protein n=1 Tax=Neospora caninum (strain Liverpool) TaxID=572307 RepID=F0VCZ6_NEOCL|nr:hypothetical protein NCLIV_013040 [Neospora caninum Liverpool]CBZ51511.1 hypothetical protein NCLIV_013040 [Neospora caninum Liverpool]CEL65461.1 TPA: hypothetical protein BN1204_013040 [Neospora caninum Liverpool]|eukprot:XP_003881544.1 hypothetical protein NCLIV_013040 [Neospora caninum Liverpool]
MADPCVDSTEAERSNTLVKDTSASGTPDGVEPYLFPIVACLGCLTTMACGPKDGDFISPAEYARGCKESPYEAALLANTKAGPLTDQELLEQIVTDFSLRAVRFDDSDNRTGLPATLIHLGNGMQLKAEYHLDFRLQNIHFKLCTKENRFIMFFFIPIKHLKDIAIPEELDPVFHASCYDRVGKFVQRPQRAAVLQVRERAICDQTPASGM